MESKEEQLRFPDWTQMPADLLGECCKRLDMPNQLRFATVCKAWHSCTSSKANSTCTPDTPWLISNDDTASQFRLFSSSLQKNFEICKPFHGSFVVGSTNGWLVIRTQPKLFILNVFSRLTIDLPPRTTNDATGMDTPLAFAISTCPNLNPINVAAVTKGGDLAWCNIADEAWKGHRGDEEYGNLTFHNHKLYAVNRYGTKIDLFQVDDESAELLPLGSIGSPRPSVTVPNAVNVYLVGSNGSLLVAKRYYENPGTEAPPTIGFDIFKVEENCTPPRVVRVNGLDGQALFVSDLNCECLDAQHCPGLEKDRIYFIGHSRNGFTSELGVFVVQNRRMIRVPLANTDKKSPIWVLPRFAFECDCPTHDFSRWKPKRKKKKICTAEN